MFVLNLLTAALSLMPSLLAQSRIECSSLNVDSTRQFNNCVSRTLGSAGSISATDQFASCNSLAGSQLKYLSCICQRSDELTECYNQFCPGDGAASVQSQNKARYCAAATSAAIVPASATYSLPPIPTIGSLPTPASVPLVTAPAGAAFARPSFDPSPSGSFQWHSSYMALVAVLISLLLVV